MDVADEMNQECQIAGRAPFVVVAVLEALCVLIDFSDDAVALAAFPCDIGLRILKTNIDEVPFFRRRVLFAKTWDRPER
jgi:hypothetical protein